MSKRAAQHSDKRSFTSADPFSRLSQPSLSLALFTTFSSDHMSHYAKADRALLKPTKRPALDITQQIEGRPGGTRLGELFAFNLSALLRPNQT
jgi:hypothetical protein